MDQKRLRSLGLKVTVPRMKILSILEQAQHRHLSAESVYLELRNSGEDVGLATVYRVLTQFEAAGIVKRHNFEGSHCVYELDEGEHHDHLVCIRCEQVQEFVDDIIETRQQRIAAQQQFKITDHSLTIYGLCQECQTVELA